VKNKCGKYSYTALAYYDYCTYPADPVYDANTLKNKSASFWKKITADPFRTPSYPNIANIFGESIQMSFDNFAFEDEMPSGRVKDIHTIGTVCPFTLNIKHSAYTGLFAKDAQEGFVRMGSAADYSNGGLTPGLGIKFPRTGAPSGNFVALHSLDLGQSWGFFAYNVSDHISSPVGATKVVGAKFNQASQCAPQVGHAPRRTEPSVQRPSSRASCSWSRARPCRPPPGRRPSTR
jgi:hypothetical protein